ncbi:hypothetical protein DVA67_028455 [Solirubrobacter sp. CPCC 204708]|uniref:Serine/threonine protein kinase n=1 Tax=Solirubrobacter deserti TaxID=2282478 RepID=A0ABT4RPI2_9ACTN|nr:hypothetical protein [Solirubrobacter deserti]MBE2319931.1 hypothetical protein [Solirubrobacter deserti]MDA0140475.1 hypothetical protein [Solirubrobacter deserti]
MRKLEPGSAVAGYRIEAVERTDRDAIVLRAGEVLLHVSEDARYLDRARRLRSVEHPHLLRLRSALELDGRPVAVLQAPAGTRLDRASPPDPIAFVQQLAGAVEALEDAGADVPPITRERIWVDERGEALLDGLGAHSHGVSPAAELARLLEELAPRRSPPLELALTRARDGAYLSAGQFAADLARAAEPSHERRRWPFRGNLN